jgi:hypothetical protein
MKPAGKRACYKDLPPKKSNWNKHANERKEETHKLQGATHKMT